MYKIPSILHTLSGLSEHYNICSWDVEEEKQYVCERKMPAGKSGFSFNDIVLSCDTEEICCVLKQPDW